AHGGSALPWAHLAPHEGNRPPDRLRDAAATRHLTLCSLPGNGKLDHLAGADAASRQAGSRADLSPAGDPACARLAPKLFFGSRLQGRKRVYFTSRSRPTSPA